MVTFCIELANDPDVVRVSELITMMAKKLEKKGKELSTSWKKNFFWKLENDVSSIKIINIERKLYVYPKNMTTEILIPKLIKARKDLENFKKKHEYKILDEANIAGVMTII